MSGKVAGLPSRLEMPPVGPFVCQYLPLFVHLAYCSRQGCDVKCKGRGGEGRGREGRAAAVLLGMTFSQSASAGNLISLKKRGYYDLGIMFTIERARYCSY